MVAFEPDSVSRSADGPGRRLRLAREKRGLDTPTVADALHLDRQVVEAIEDDNYEVLPPKTFSKGYVRSYARFLDLDESEILAAFDRLGMHDTDRPIGVSAVAGRRNSVVGSGALLGVLLIAVAAGGWYLVAARGWRPPWVEPVSQTSIGEPSGRDADAGTSTGEVSSDAAAGATPDSDAISQQDTLASRSTDAAGSSEPVDASDRAEAPDAPPDASAAAEEVDAADGADTVGGRDEPNRGGDELAATEASSVQRGDRESVEAVDSGASGQIDTDDGATRAAAGEQAQADDPAGESAADAESPSPADSPADETVAESADSQPLVFTFTAESWMEVRDARGRRLLFGLMGADGESRRVRGVPPFDIVIGDVGGVTVKYQGEAVDLGSYTRGSVARLNLGESP